MDNVCHTLAGAVLAEAGLRRRTPLAVPTLLIGANLPDIDVLAYLRDPLFALSVRRGWTHGVLAVVLLPVLLAGAMLGWQRLARRNHDQPRADPGSLLLVGAVAVLSHPLLDLLNTYGVRLLMPFSARWFYADTLFVVDPWLWLLFGAGAAIAWRRRRRGLTGAAAERPARLALAVAAGYIVAMAVMGLVGRGLVRDAALAAGITAVSQEMVAPVPADPFRRSLVLATPGGYRLGVLNWLRSPRVVFESSVIPSGFGSPEVAAAAASARGAAFLGWSRFPVALTRRTGEGEAVRLYDLRYGGPDGESWAAVEIPVGRVGAGIENRVTAVVTALRSPHSPRRQGPAPLPPVPSRPSDPSQTGSAAGRCRCRSPA